MSAGREDGGAVDHGMPPEGHRLPGGTRLGPVRLQVADLERSIGYYESVLGLQVVAEDGKGTTTLGVEAEDTGDGTHLVELRERPGASPLPRGGRLGLYHFAILLPDRAHLGRFAAHLARIQAPVGAADHWVSEALYLHDPDGLGIEVYSDRARSHWRYQGRQLVMATDRLAMDDLLRAGADRPWTRMPGGTVMGHVHLHVGDLPASEAFYHQGLGFDKTVWSYPGALFLSAGGYHHHLGLNTWASGASPAREADARLLEWQLRLPTAEAVDGVADSLRTAGHAVEVEGEGRVGVEDPWGVRLLVLAEPPPGGPPGSA